MIGKDLLVLQLSGSFSLIAERLNSEEVSQRWAEVAFEGANPSGFTLWHCARTIDWGVECAIRGVDEVARRPAWVSRIPARFRFGAGISPSAAREVAALFSPSVVADYLEAVKTESLGWLEAQSDATLDVVPDFRAHNECVDGYTDPKVWSEIQGLEGIPAWEILARPCISHIRIHIGEVDTMLQVLASSGSN
jgi:hypothetical protein